MRTVNFSRNLSALRRAKRITQEQMAEKCGVSRQAVTKWESGSSLPDLYKLSDIAEILEVSTDELLFGEADNRAEQNLVALEERLKATQERVEKLSENIHGGSNSDEVLSDEEAACMFLVDSIDETMEEEFGEIGLYYVYAELAFEDGLKDAAMYMLEQGLIRGSLECGYLLLEHQMDFFREKEELEQFDDEYFDYVLSKMFVVKGYVRIIERIFELQRDHEELRDLEFSAETFKKYRSELG